MHKLLALYSNKVNLIKNYGNKEKQEIIIHNSNALLRVAGEVELADDLQSLAPSLFQLGYEDYMCEVEHLFDDYIRDKLSTLSIDEQIRILNYFCELLTNRYKDFPKLDETDLNIYSEVLLLSGTLSTYYLNILEPASRQQVRQDVPKRLFNAAYKVSLKEGSAELELSNPQELDRIKTLFKYKIDLIKSFSKLNTVQEMVEHINNTAIDSEAKYLTDTLSNIWIDEEDFDKTDEEYIEVLSSLYSDEFTYFTGLDSNDAVSWFVYAVDYLFDEFKYLEGYQGELHLLSEYQIVTNLIYELEQLYRQQLYNRHDDIQNYKKLNYITDLLD